MIRLLRALAFVGPFAILAVELIPSLPLEPRQGYALPVIALTASTVLFLVMAIRRKSVRMFGAHADLLVPLGLYIVTTKMLGWFLALPLMASATSSSEPLSILGLPLTLSWAMFFSIAIAVIHATWAITLICQVIRGDTLDLRAGWNSIRTSGWRVFFAMALGTVPLFLGVGLAVSFAAVAMPLAMLSIGIGTVLLSFATAGLLLHVVARPAQPFWSGLGSSVRISLRYSAQWWAPLLAQMVVLGLVTFSDVSYTIGSINKANTNWGINGLWTGAFETDSQWLGKLMESVEASPPAFAPTALTILLGVLAVAIKVRIAAALHEGGELF